MLNVTSPAALRVGFAGTPEFAAVALDALLLGGYRPEVVYTQPDRPAGRGRRPQPSAVKRRALAAELPLRQPPTLRDAAARRGLADSNLDLLIVAAYGLLLPRPVLDTPRLGCVNIHASLLPRWRGAAPVQRALLAGDAETGVCIMQMDAGLDTGPVYTLRRCPIAPTASAGELHDTLAALGAEALLATLPGLAAGTLTATPQSELPGVASYADKIDKREARLDWRLPAGELARRVRAFNPWPTAYTDLLPAATQEAGGDDAPRTAREATDAGTKRTAAQRLRVYAAVPLPDAAVAATPGEILAAGRDGVVVACGGATRLALQTLQLAGKKPLDAAAFSAAGGLVGRRLGDAGGAGEAGGRRRGSATPSR